MEIELANQTGQPVPQFVVRPESTEERMLLKAFFHHIHTPNVEFCIHGITWRDSEFQSFNFSCRDKS